MSSTKRPGRLRSLEAEARVSQTSPDGYGEVIPLRPKPATGTRTSSTRRASADTESWHPRTGWKFSGVCNELDDPDAVMYEPPNLPMSRRQVRAARAVCKGCRVQRDCLTDALMRKDRWGVWGSFTSAERLRALEMAEDALGPVPMDQLVLWVMAHYNMGTLRIMVVKI